MLVPIYLPDSSLLSKPRLGITAGALWVGAQALWLWQGYELEFLGRSTFVPGLWGSGLVFYAVNMWILGIIVDDIGGKPMSAGSAYRLRDEKLVAQRSKG